jgi:uncharacterized protein
MRSGFTGAEPDRLEQTTQRPHFACGRSRIPGGIVYFPVAMTHQPPPAKDLLRYDLLVQEALKGVVRKVLQDAGKDGLPGEHHFYISFRTDFAGVRLSQRMRDKYPDEMTIVLQHQFWDLGVTEHAFEVGLSFGGVPERLLIPFDAIVGFYDPSVQFGLKFELNGEASEAAGDDQAASPPAGKLAPVIAAVPGARSEPVETLPAPRKAKDKDKDKPAPQEATTAAESGDAGPAPAEGARIVSLDSFRKKN